MKKTTNENKIETNVEIEKNDNSFSKKKLYLSIGAVLLALGFVLFVACFVWVLVKDSSIESTRWERTLPMIIMLVSLVPMGVGTALLVIANKKWKNTKAPIEKVEKEEKPKKPKNYPKKNRNPRLGEIAYWRVEEQKPEEDNPFDMIEISLTDKKDKNT